MSNIFKSSNLNSDFIAFVNKVLKDQPVGTYQIRLQNDDYTFESGGVRPVDIGVEKHEDSITIRNFANFAYNADGELTICDYFDLVGCVCLINATIEMSLYDEEDPLDAVNLNLYNIYNYISMRIFTDILLGRVDKTEVQENV